MKHLFQRKGFAFLTIATFLIGGFLLFGVNTPVVNAATSSTASTTLYVNGSATSTTSTTSTLGTQNNPYKTIQSAITAASSGDTIDVANGTYTLNKELDITQVLTLKGEGEGSVIIKATSSSWVATNESKHLVEVSAGATSSPVTISNITFDSSNNAYGVQAYGNVHLNLDNVTLKNSKGAGLTVNGSNVTANGLNTKDNAWGAVNVDPGSGVKTPSVFTLSSSNSKLGEVNQIWSDGEYATGTATVAVNANGYNKYNVAIKSPSFFIWTNRPLANVATITKDSVTSIYYSIQSAIDVASSGDTIAVAKGTYTGNVDITEGIILKSVSGAASTTISGTTGNVVTVSADNVTINGFTITNNKTAGTGIYSSDHSNLTITNNIVTKIGNNSNNIVGRGIEIISASSAVKDISITNNQINNITSGLSKNGSVSGGTSASAISIGWHKKGNGNITNLLIQNNTISDINADTTAWTKTSGGWATANRGYGAYGILINHKTNGAQILGNTISNLTGLWAHAIGLEGDTPDAVVAGNIISNLTDNKTPSDAVAVHFEDNPNAGTALVHNNSFSDVHVGVNTTGTSTIDAIGNWWGINLPNFTSIVSGHVTYSPWFTNSDMTNLEYTTATTSTTTTAETGSNPEILTGTSTVGSLVVTANIPTGTTITGDALWNGILSPPTATTATVSLSGFNTKVTSAIEIGSSDSDLTFSNPVKLTFAGQAGKRVGWYNHAGTFTEITAPCGTSTPLALTAGASCKTNSSQDLIVWTTHFSKFVTYTQSAIPAPAPVSSGGGGGGYIPATCSSVVYGAWGTPFNNIQYRNVISRAPSSCSLTANQRSASSRTYVSPVKKTAPKVTPQPVTKPRTKTSTTNKTTVNKKTVTKGLQKVLGVKIFANGTLLRATNHRIYVVKNGVLQYIHSLKELSNNYAGQAILKVSSKVITSYGQEVLGIKAYANGSLIRGANKKVYVITNGKKVHILNLIELRKYTGRVINDVSAAVLNEY